MLNIDKALGHFKWKFENHWKPTKKDLEAYNAIVDYKKLQEERSLSENESLTKLWIHQLILLSQTKMYDGGRCIQVLDEILSKTVYNWCVILQNEIPMMRFNSVGLSKYPLDEKDALNITKINERNEKIINEFETELTEALKTEVSEDNIIKFVEKNISRVLTKFEK